MSKRRDAVWRVRARKIAATLTAVGASRFDVKYGMGGLSHQALMTNIELYGRSSHACASSWTDRGRVTDDWPPADATPAAANVSCGP